MAMIRRPETLAAIIAEYRSRRTDKRLRSYYIPEYQDNILDILSRETGQSKAAIIRQIIDEWVEVNAEGAPVT